MLVVEKKVQEKPKNLVNIVYVFIVDVAKDAIVLNYGSSNEIDIV